MKMFKRVLAAGAALMMAVTGMTMSASADYASGGPVYQLHYDAAAAPYGANVTVQYFGSKIVPYTFPISTTGKISIENQPLTMNGTGIKNKVYYCSFPPSGSWISIDEISLSSLTGKRKQFTHNTLYGYPARSEVRMVNYNTSGNSSATGRTLAY